ncbi:MAG TPA: hypothetical protein PK079_23980 [Leptospiraceae bacterium]|nr:hypothetical protein [Leptospiraceae bacterium]HMZ66496.1 hypothetical protein [Leptospiraceae bacterium]HNA10038.1 hypothetical protein [Leptospiraceae bacterium]HNC00435.1 hypothetical protein [Leptospiraceae bacterium]HNC59375.1 hypothetical protein [Leptospiraceae bacterium]
MNNKKPNTIGDFRKRYENALYKPTLVERIKNFFRPKKTYIYIVQDLSNPECVHKLTFREGGAK